MTLRIMTIYGTRPEAIKVAPIIKAIEADADLENVLVVTGQHREMLDQVNTMFEIVPDHDLNIMAAGQSLNGIVAKVISGVDEILENETPDAVIVQGDTSTVMGAAVASFNRQIPVLHLEAGLRSGDINSPFPEEANRKLTSQIAALHLAPTSTSKANLTREDVSENDIVVTGNSVIDTLLHATATLEVRFDDERLEELQRSLGNEGPERILLVTAHRRENLGSAMEDIGGAVADLARKYPDLTIVFPIHKNPKVRASIRPAVEGLDNVLLIEPLAVRPVHAGTEPREHRPDRLRRRAGGGPEPGQARAGHAGEHGATRGRRLGNGEADRHAPPASRRRGLPPDGFPRGLRSHGECREPLR